MTSSTNGININNELASFYSAFRADDTLIDIIPAFDYSYNNDDSNSNRRNTSVPDEYNNDIDDDMSNLFQSTLSSTSIFGGSYHVKAGLTYTVPIWMAMLLQQRSFATIVYPTDLWYNINNLKYILLYEKTNVSLFHTTTTTTTTNDTNDTTITKPPQQRRNNRHGNDNDDDSNDDDDDETIDNHHNETRVSQESSIKNNDYYLPSNYFELAMRFKASISTTTTTSNTNTTTTSNTTTTTTMNHIDVLTLLIQDIYDIRMDKLRQQFQTLLYDTTKHISPSTNSSSNSNSNSRSTTTTNPTLSRSTDLIINVTGIGTQELTQIQSYVIQAMNDIYYLES